MSTPLPAFNAPQTCFRGEELKEFLLDLAEKNKALVTKTDLLEVTPRTRFLAPAQF